MIETLKREWTAQIALFLFVVFAFWWVEINLYHPSNATEQLKFFTSMYGFLALWGAICGLIISKKWGGIKSVMGRAIIMFSLGLLAQEFGQIAYSYYYYGLNVDIPYPSVGDIGYFGSIILYIYGTLLLAKASGVHVSLRSIKTKIQAIIIPLIILVMAYTLFLQGYTFDWVYPLTIVLDFGYPLGQAIYISIAFLTFLLTRGILGGVMKFRILSILFALFVQFIADYTFLYQTSRGLWVAGHINDFMYLFAYFIMTLSLIQMGRVYDQLQHKE